jgi:hypothetical protein
VELDAISQPELDQIERMGRADLVVGIFDLEGKGDGRNDLAMTRNALAELSRPLRTPLRTMVICNNGAHPGATVGAEVNHDNASSEISIYSLPLPGPAQTAQQSISNVYRKVFTVGGKLGARACSVIISQPQAVTRDWIFRLVQPVMDLGFDLVTPCYTRQKMEGLLTRSILSPLQRALYGEQIQNPMGPDFGLSGKLLQRVLMQDSARRRGAEVNALALMASTAAGGGFQICETHLGVRAQLAIDWGNLSSLLAEVLGPVFLDMEGRAAHWQRIRGSRTLPRFGQPEPPPPDTGSADVHGMIESFRLGTQNLHDVWGMVLPPTTLLELRRLSRLPEDQFRLPDQVWVRIVYDFALGHHLRTISRDHLLRSITPLYLGWIASFALETQTAGLDEVDARIERLSKAYEDNKSYLVSRWRWPDRFNP